MRSEHRRDIVLAFHVAALSRAKKIPPLESLLRRLETPGDRRPMKWQEMAAIARQWTTVLGVIADRKGATG